MALTKTDLVNQIEIVSEYKHIQIRNQDNVIISQTYHRRTLNCGQLDASNNLVETDISSESAEIAGICNLVWTDAVKSAWTTNLIAAKG